MSGSSALRQPSGGRAGLQIPHEHGFWVMLAAVVLAALLAQPTVASLLTAVVVVAGAALLGSLVHMRIRRQPWLQLASALALAAAGAPVELMARTPLVDVAYDAAAWAAVFVGFTLSVWACTARNSRVRRRQVGALTACAVLAPLAGAVALELAERRGHALAALFGAAASSVFAIWRPGSKQMKAIGFTLAGCALIVALILIVL